MLNNNFCFQNRAMEREKEHTIHVKYKADSRILSTKRSDFLSTACSKFNLNENNVDIYEIIKIDNQPSLKKIDIANLKPFMHVEIIEKQSSSTDQVNGHRLNKILFFIF